MQYTAALIEYVITGLVSLLWIALLMSANIDFVSIDYNKFKELILIAIFPLAYIAGIFIDTISSLLFKAAERVFRCVFLSFSKWFRCVFFFFSKKVKEHLKVRARRSNDKNAFNTSYKKSAEILSYSISDIIRTMESYLSRDRIVRGMALNSLMIGISMMAVLDLEKRYFIFSLPFFLCIISIVIRVRLKALSDCFKVRAVHNLRLRSIDKK